MPSSPVISSETFSIEQLEALMAWSRDRPVGLRVTISVDHARFPEVALIWRNKLSGAPYLIHPATNGTVVLTDVNRGAVWAIRSVEECLARIVNIESGSSWFAAWR